MESTVTRATVIHHSQENTVKWSRFPVLPIHVRREESASRLQITLLIPAAVDLAGKENTAMKM